MTTLDSFLRHAKAATYASGKPKDVTRSYNRSDDYFYEQNGYTYHDRYWGGIAFLGSEIIWHNGAPV